MDHSVFKGFLVQYDFQVKIYEGHSSLSLVRWLGNGTVRMAFRRVLLAASLKTWYPEQRTISPYFQANLNRPCLAAQRRFLVTKREPVYVERMEPSLIAVVQMTSGNDKEKNMQLCNSLITQASEKKAKV